MSKKVFLTLTLIISLPFLVWFVGNQSTTLRSVTKTNPLSTPLMPSKKAISVKLATLERGWVKKRRTMGPKSSFFCSGIFWTTWVAKDGELLHVAVKREECKDKTVNIQNMSFQKLGNF